MTDWEVFFFCGEDDGGEGDGNFRLPARMTNWDVIPASGGN